MEALRNTGYSNISAISDLVDNSIDAEATKIHIKLQLSPQNLQDSQVIVADDGYGMSWETLRQAMRLGSDVFHDLGRDLGKYGMGLVTASISIGRRLTVISRKDGLTNTAIQDLDTIIERNRFEISLRPATESESELFDQETGNATSGTVVIISNCDRIQYAKENDFAKAFETEFRWAISQIVLQMKELSGATVYGVAIPETEKEICLRLMCNNKGLKRLKVRLYLAYKAKNGEYYAEEMKPSAIYT